MTTHSFFKFSTLAALPLVLALGGCSVNVDRQPSARVVHETDVHVVPDNKDRVQTITSPDGTRIQTRD